MKFQVIIGDFFVARFSFLRPLPKRSVFIKFENYYLVCATLITFCAENPKLYVLRCRDVRFLGLENCDFGVEYWKYLKARI